MPIQEKINALFHARRERPRTELGTIADESARLVEVAKELIAIAGDKDDPMLLEQLSHPIAEILKSSKTLSSSVIKLARTGD